MRRTMLARRIKLSDTNLRFTFLVTMCRLTYPSAETQP
jgi:hypothetical protein